MMPPNCDGCRRPVIWAVTSANTKWIRLNPQPDPDGNQAAYRDGVGTWRTRQLKDGEEPQGFERRFMPHVATCTAEPRQQATAKAPQEPPRNVVQLAGWRRSPHPRKDRP